MTGSHEVRGSIPLGSTNPKSQVKAASFLAEFVNSVMPGTDRRVIKNADIREVGERRKLLPKGAPV